MEFHTDRRRFLKLLSFLSLLPLLETGCCASAAPVTSQQGQDQPNVIILLFDTLSARHMSLHGYGRETTPGMARFAERATVYHAHYAAGNYTPPGTASLLTGTYPWTHRAFHFGGLVAEGYQDRNLLKLFGDGYSRILYSQNRWADLLLHQFRQDGDVHMVPHEFCLADDTFPDHLLSNDTDIAYRSFNDLLFRAVLPGSLYLALAQNLNSLLHERVELREYADLYPRGVPRMTPNDIPFLFEHVINGLMALLSSSRPSFLAYFHLFPPHAPYRSRREFVGIFDDGWVPVTKAPHPFSDGHSQEALNRWRTEYDEYVAYTDAEFGRLHDFMESTGLLESSYVVITSDHGELFERGVQGHVTELLYEPVIRIPLLISSPGQQRHEDVYVATSCVDLLPTLLHVTGQPIPEWCEGEILPTMGAEQDSRERSIFSLEAKRNPARRPLSVGTVALIRNHHKLIRYFGYDGYENEYELYDLSNDPQELENLYSTKRSVATDLQHELDEKLREVNQPYAP